MSGDKGLVTKAMAGKGTVTGTVGIKLVSPTPPIVAAGTAVKVGAGKREAVVIGAFAYRTGPAPSNGGGGGKKGV